MTLWMEVTQDEYELPVAVAESAGILARKIGKSKKTIISAMRKAQIRQEKQGHTRCRYVKVEVDDGEDQSDLG